MGADTRTGRAGSVPSVDGTSDDDEVDLPPVGPLHPDDRLWRHPSELVSAGFPSAVQTPPPKGRGRSDTTPGENVPGGHRSRRGILDRWGPVLLAGTVGALLTTGLLALTGGFGRGPDEPASLAMTSSTKAVSISSQTQLLGVAELAERMRPSLVAVFGVAADGRVSRGSAVAIRSGHVLTAARLVVDSLELQVLVGGIGRRASVVGSDPDTDLAVLAVEGGGLVPVSWAAGSDLRPGDPAIAVSCPPAAEPGPTVTAGIVSGVARTLAHAGTELRGLLQVDRPVPAEGAGGALLDPSGDLVGITLPAAAANAPFGYAVPAEAAQDVARQLLERGRVAHPWLGVEGGDRGMNGGAVVERVKPGSPAASAGLLEDDLVTAINDAPTPSMGMLLVVLRHYQPGDTVRLLVRRANRAVAVSVTLQERP